jgi:hypothetical protein
MAWFGLIFLGSIFNAIAFELGMLENSSEITYICYAFGFILGLVAKLRGTWTWKTNS